MPFRVREVRPADRADCYDICLRTGDSGADATALYEDPDLLGAVYAGPYLGLPEGLGYVAVDEAGVSGYVLGTADTRAFEAACEARWWPALRTTHPEPGADLRTRDDGLRWLIHHPPLAPDDIVGSYPAHLHIDLLPRTQGGGVGRVLTEQILARFTQAGACGVHLGVARANTRAIGFYRHLGFATFAEDPGSLLLCRRL